MADCAGRLVRAWVVHYRLSDWGVTAASTMPAPFLSQHNRTIAAQLSYSPAQIEQLCAHGVLYAENTGQ